MKLGKCYQTAVPREKILSFLSLHISISIIQMKLLCVESILNSLYLGFNSGIYTLLLNTQCTLYIAQCTGYIIRHGMFLIYVFYMAIIIRVVYLLWLQCRSLNRSFLPTSSSNLILYSHIFRCFQFIIQLLASSAIICCELCIRRERLEILTPKQAQ